MTVQTQLSERELANRIHDCIEKLYAKVVTRKAGDVEADEKVAELLDELGTYKDKLEYANLSRLRYDADINSRNDEALEKIEHMLRNIVIEQKHGIRAIDYLKSVAKRLKWKVSGMAKKAEREKGRKLRDIEKKQRDLEKQKKDIEKNKK